MEWIISIIIIYFLIGYILDKLKIWRWRRDKHERVYQMVSTDAHYYGPYDDPLFGNSTPSMEQLFLQIVVTDGYIKVKGLVYYRDGESSYVSQEGNTIYFVEGSRLSCHYSEGDTYASEFIVLKDKKPIKRHDIQKKTIHHNTLLKKEEKSKEDKILDNLGIQYIYHMTHIDNLHNILENGLLSHGNHLVKKDISNQDVNDRRNIKDPIYNRSIHSYVPFYFSPRNAMLYSRKEIQSNLVILALDRSLIYKQDSLYTDGNAASDGTGYYNDLNQIQNLNWKCIHAKTWTDFQDGKRIKMAETLVYNHVPTKYIQKIFCNNTRLKRYIENMVNPDLQIKVEINQSLFF